MRNGNNSLIGTCFCLAYSSRVSDKIRDTAVTGLLRITTELLALLGASHQRANASSKMDAIASWAAGLIGRFSTASTNFSHQGAEVRLLQ